MRPIPTSLALALALALGFAATSPTLAQTASTATKKRPAGTPAPTYPPTLPQRPPAEVSIDQLIERARTQLGNNAFTDALATAQEAQRKAPRDYRAPYYIAYALMSLGDLDGALAAQEKALALADNPQREASVKKLAASIESRKALIDAEEAANAGLNGKAARLFAEAFDKGGPPEAAVKAAQIQSSQLGDVVTAARLLNRVLADHPTSAAGQQAADLLVSLKPRIATLADNREREAQRLPAGERTKAYHEILELVPDHQKARIGLLKLAAQEENWDDFKQQAIALAKTNAFLPTLAHEDLVLDAWADDPRLRELFTDMWGQAKVDEALGNIAKAKAARRNSVLANNVHKVDLGGLRVGMSRTAFLEEMRQRAQAIETGHAYARSYLSQPSRWLRVVDEKNNVQTVEFGLRHGTNLYHVTSSSLYNAYNGTLPARVFPTPAERTTIERIDDVLSPPGQPAWVASVLPAVTHYKITKVILRGNVVSGIQITAYHAPNWSDLDGLQRSMEKHFGRTLSRTDQAPRKGYSMTYTLMGFGTEDVVIATNSTAAINDSQQRTSAYSTELTVWSCPPHRYCGYVK